MTANPTLRSSADWAREYPHIFIMDPDGWDRKNFEASRGELITREVFVSRMARSTCRRTVLTQPT
jgi:hypothetical protein